MNEFCEHQLEKLHDFMNTRVPYDRDTNKDLPNLVHNIAMIFWDGCIECKRDNYEIITVMGQPFTIKELEDIANKKYEMQTHTCFTINSKGKLKKNN